MYISIADYKTIDVSTRHYIRAAFMNIPDKLKKSVTHK